MSGSIANQWTGDGLAEDTAIASGNVATSGNFSGSGVSAWTRGVSSSPAPTLFTTKNHGIRFTGATSAVGDIRATFPIAYNVLSQIEITVGDISSAAADLLQTRVSQTGARAAGFLIDANRQPYFNNSSNVTLGTKGPALAIGDDIVVDMVVIQDSSAPTTTNGRIFGRVKNKTNSSWNTTGDYFVDTGYTTNTGTGGLTQVYGGQNGGGILGATNAWDFQFIGAQAITVNPTDTSASAAKTYFADAPVTSTPLTPPTPVLGAKTTPTTVGGNDGTQVISWAPVANAVAYDVYISGSSTPAQEDFVRVGTNVTSPFTVTGLTPGTRSYGVKAKVSTS